MPPQLSSSYFALLLMTPPYKPPAEIRLPVWKRGFKEKREIRMPSSLSHDRITIYAHRISSLARSSRASCKGKYNGISELYRSKSRWEKTTNMTRSSCSHTKETLERG